MADGLRLAQTFDPVVKILAHSPLIEQILALRVDVEKAQTYQTFCQHAVNHLEGMLNALDERWNAEDYQSVEVAHRHHSSLSKMVPYIPNAETTEQTSSQHGNFALRRVRLSGSTTWRIGRSLPLLTWQWAITRTRVHI